MLLNDVMTFEEKDATVKLIAAHLAVEEAKTALDKAQADYAKIGRKFTELWWRTDEGDESIGTIPDNFVALFDGKPYFVQVDADGESRHKVVLLAGILSEPE